MSWAGRIRNALRPERVGREIDRELAFHLAEEIEELQAAGLNEMEQFGRRSARSGTGHTRRKGYGTWTSISEYRRRCGTSGMRHGESSRRQDSRLR